MRYKIVIYYLLIVFGIFSTPLFAMAQNAPEDFKDLITFALFYVNKLIPIIFMMTFLSFVWGMALFIRHSDNEDGVKNGKRVMIVSVIAFFVALSFRASYMFLADNILGPDVGGVPLINRARLNEVVPPPTPQTP